MNPTPALARPSLERELAELRQPLLAYCYRMLGSVLEAEDAVQETMMRAWRSAGRLAGPDGLRPWMYRIATNVCVDAASDRKRRALPMDLVTAADPRAGLGAPLPESTWVQPFPTAAGTDPSATRRCARAWRTWPSPRPPWWRPPVSRPPSCPGSAPDGRSCWRRSARRPDCSGSPEFPCAPRTGRICFRAGWAWDCPWSPSRWRRSSASPSGSAASRAAWWKPPARSVARSAPPSSRRVAIAVARGASGGAATALTEGFRRGSLIAAAFSVVAAVTALTVVRRAERSARAVASAGAEAGR
ncbi:sigma factor [Nocardia thraciensis]